jgi:hypothetical protein
MNRECGPAAAPVGGVCVDVSVGAGSSGRPSLFNAPQVGAYITVVLIVPRASPEVLRVIALLALGTAVYGAALARGPRSRAAWTGEGKEFPGTG